MDFKYKRPKKEVYDRRRLSLGYSVKSGIFHSVMVGFGESFISPFAIFLKATASQLALLSSLPQLSGSLSQLLTPKFLEFFKSRKWIVAIATLLQALVWVPIVYAFYLSGFAVPYLILFVCVYWVLGMFVNPVWNSWMGDLVDPELSSRFFGSRNKAVGIASLIAILVAGFVLNIFKSANITFVGFVFIFVVALVARLISFFYITRKYEPEYIVYDSAKFSFFEFVKQMRFRNYGLFVIYLSLMNFAVYIAAPFFSLYMLQDLKFSYLTFTLVTASSMFAKVMFMPFWGKLIEKYGSKKVLAFTGYVMPFTPVLWLFSSSVSYLLLVQVYSGIVWSGFEFASSYFIFDSTSSSKRARCIAYYNVINGVMILFGTLFGALLVKYPVYFSSFFFVFLVSGILRYAVSFVMIPKIKEVRTVAEISYGSLFFKVLAAVPGEGFSMISSAWKNNKPFKKF